MPALALEVDIAWVGAVLAACVAAVLAVGTLALAGAPLDLFDPAARGANPVHPQHPGDRWLTVPNLVSGGLFLAAGALAVLLRREGSNRRPAAALAVLCSLLGVEQLAAVHERVAAGEPASPLWIAVFVFGAGAFSLTWLSSPRSRRLDALLAVGGGLWLLGRVTEAAWHLADPGPAAAAVAFDLTAGALLAIAVLVGVQGAHRLSGRPARNPAALGHTFRMDDVDLLRGAFALTVLILGLGVLGALERGEVLDLPAFDMNAERSVPTLFSGGLLLAVAGSAYALGRSQDGQATRSWWVLALFFTFMALDETMSVHERLQSRTDVNGQVLLAPVVLAGAAAWVSAVRAAWRHRGARWLLVGGAAAWLATQVTDVVQSSGLLDALSVPEEMLEMGGSSLFLLAMLTLLQARARGASAADRRAVPASPRRASSSADATRQSLSRPTLSG